MLLNYICRFTFISYHNTCMHELSIDLRQSVNTANCADFEDSLNVTPRQPYNPSLQPDRTILKPSPDTSWLKLPTTAKRKSLRTRPRAADFFWASNLL